MLNMREKKLFLLCLLVTATASIAGIFQAIILKLLFDYTPSATEPNGLFNLLLGISLYMSLTIALKFIRKLSCAYFTKIYLTRIKHESFMQTLSQPVSDFYQKKIGEHIANMTNIWALIEQNYYQQLIGLTDALLSLVVAFCLLLWLNPYMAFACAIGSVIPLSLSKWTAARQQQLQEAYLERMEHYTGKVKELLNGFELIRSYGVQIPAQSDFTTHNSLVENQKYQYGNFAALVQTTQMTLAYGIQILVIAIGIFLAVRGSLTLGGVIAAGQLMGMMMNPIASIGIRLSTIKATKPLLKETNRHMAPIAKDKTTVDFPLSYKKIELTHVNFQYPNSKSGLYDLSLTIERGKKYAIIGPSGGGKSTLLKLLMRYYEPSSGIIKIDHNDLSSINEASLYSQIALLHQQVFIFDGTVEDNIQLFSTSSKDLLASAVYRSGLKELVDALPNGIQTEIGQWGGQLSGGERQRLAIARALYRQADVLLLDEFTASLDSERSHALEHEILQLKDITIVHITHKFNPVTLSQYDGIFLIQDGHLIAQGKYSELLENSNFRMFLVHQHLQSIA